MAENGFKDVVAYGAFQLKATYQRNMLLAMGATTGLVTLLVVLGTVLFGSSNAPASTHPGVSIEVDTVRHHFLPPPTVRISSPEVRPETPRIPVRSAANLTPVDDTAITYEAPIDFRTMTGDPRDGFDTGSGGGGGLGLGSFGDTVDWLPPIDSFIRVEQQPVLVYSINPDYPRWAREVEIEGTVVIKALVGRKGDVLDAVVFVSSGNKLLDEAALAVAGKYKYQPAVQNGRPVALWVTYKVAFELDR